MKPEQKEKLSNLIDCLYVGIGSSGVLSGIIGMINDPQVIQSWNFEKSYLDLYTIVGGTILAKGIYNLAVSYKKK
jgi:hypothetical protein